MKLLDKAIAAKAIKQQREFDRGWGLGESLISRGDYVQAVEQLRRWRGDEPNDIEYVTAVAVGYADRERASRFLVDVFGKNPFNCRSRCIAGFMAAINHN